MRKQKTTYKNKVVTGLVMATTVLAMVGAPAVGMMVQPMTVQAEANKNVVADNTSARSITLYKYAVSDMSQVGDRGDGTMDTTVSHNPLAGIKFDIQRVVPKAGGASLVNPQDQVEGTDYTIDATFTKMTGTTGADGKLVFDLGTGTAADGIYLITELDDSRVATPTPPFFVHVPQTNRADNGSLIYDVVVQPKNVVKDIVDPDKTINGEKGHSIKAGEQFTWDATTNLPSGLFQVAAQDMTISPVYDKDGNKVADKVVKKGDEIYANYFTIEDTLVKELLLDSAVLQVKKGAGTWEELVFGTDYEITLNGTKVTALPVVDASDAEKALVFSLTEAGMKKVTEGKYTDIRAHLTTHVNKDFNGIISNQMEVNYLIPGQEPITVTPPEEEKPKLYDGGLDILKKAEDTKAALAGAEFHISLTEDDAKEGKFLAENGKTYGSGSVEAAQAAAEADGTTLIKATSNASGLAEFNGLALDVPNPTVTPIDEAQVKRVYWVTETKAPEGYELIKAPQSVEVNLTTAEDATVELEVVDKPKTDLPFTGGQGAALLVTIAVGTIALGTAIVVMDKKRRQA